MADSVHIPRLNLRDRLIRGTFNASLRSLDALGVAPVSSDRRRQEDSAEVDRDAARQEIRGLSHDIGESYARHVLRGRRAWQESFREMGQAIIDDADAGRAGLDAYEPYLRTPFVKGNRLVLLDSNPADFALRMRLVDRARRFVSCCFWSVANDDTGREFAARLARRAREGLDVSLGIDAGVADRLRYIDPAYPEFLAGLTDAGVDVRLLSTDEPGVSCHRKVFVVDGHHAIVGGRNIGDAYARQDPGCFLDTDLHVQGPAAAEIGDFLHDLMRLPRVPLDHAGPTEDGTDGSVALLDHEAGIGKDDAIVMAAVQAVHRARTSVDLAFAYFVPMPPMTRALHAAADRGVRVRLVTNSAETSDYPLFAGSSCRFMQPLAADPRVEIHLMRRGALHSKFGVFDGELSLLGSHNLWPLSSLHDSEANLLVHDKTVAGQLLRTLKRRLEDAERAGEDEFRPPRDLAHRMAGKVLFAVPSE